SSGPSPARPRRPSGPRASDGRAARSRRSFRRARGPRSAASPERDPWTSVASLSGLAPEPLRDPGRAVDGGGESAEGYGTQHPQDPAAYPPAQEAAEGRIHETAERRQHEALRPLHEAPGAAHGHGLPAGLRVAHELGAREPRRGQERAERPLAVVVDEAE